MLQTHDVLLLQKFQALILIQVKCASEVQVSEYHFDVMRLPVILLHIGTPFFYETIFDNAFDLAFSDFLHFFFSAGFEMAAGEG